MLNRVMSRHRHVFCTVAVSVFAAAPTVEARIIGDSVACQRDVDDAVNEVLRNVDCLGNREAQGGIGNLNSTGDAIAIVHCIRGITGHSATQPVGGRNSEIYWFSDSSLAYVGDTCSQGRFTSLVHELLHAADRARGSFATTPPCPGGVPSSRERDTVRRENYFRRDKGLCQRHTYCGVRLPPDTYAAACFCCRCSDIQRPPLPPVCSDSPGCLYDESGPEGVTPGPVCNGCPCGSEIGFPSAGSCNIHYPATAPGCS